MKMDGVRGVTKVLLKRPMNPTLGQRQPVLVATVNDE
jgi:hypothetical protein